MWIYDTYGPTSFSTPRTLILYENRKGRVINHTNARMVNFFTIQGMIFLLSVDWYDNVTLLNLASNQTTLLQTLDPGTYNDNHMFNLPFYK